MKTSRETEYEIPEDATSKEVENTLMEAVEDDADGIFPDCDIVDIQ